MKRVLRWIGLILGGVIVLVLVAAVITHFMSERVLNQRYPVPALSLSVPTDPADIAEG